MQVVLGNRQYRTDGKKSPISGRLLNVEYQNDFGMWKRVRNVSHREQVLQKLEELGRA